MFFRVPNNRTLPPAAAPAQTNIVFVRGDYQGDAVTSCHAEQKLLAALGLFLRLNPNFRTPVRVAGCKAACGTCRAVLAAVVTRLSARPMTLRYESTYVDTQRRIARIGVDNNPARALDVAHYFP